MSGIVLDVDGNQIAGGVGDVGAKDSFSDVDAEAAVQERAVAHVGEVCLGGVQEVVNPLVIFGLPAPLLDADLAV